jgi:predicted nucleic-acid-binding protein
VKITADTNVLLRVVVGDDEAQQQVALETLESAEVVAISAHSLCEFVWVLDRGYKTARGEIASVIRHVLEMHNVVVSRPAVESGLRMLETGGDFADGVIVYEGNWLGGETFVSFDKKAVSLVSQQGRQARLLA